MNDEALAGTPLSLKQQVLLTTDGTVTDLIALFSGENIHISKLAQERLHGDGPDILQLAAPTDLLKRVVLLSGKEQHYLYAESYFVIDAMPGKLQRELLETETPIGLLWKQARLEMYRELIDRSLENRPDLLDYFPNAESERFLSRSYLVYHQRKPLGVITEKFPLRYFR